MQIWKLKLKMKYLVVVAVGKGCGSPVSAKIPRAPGAGVHKAIVLQSLCDQTATTSEYVLEEPETVEIA